MEPVIKLLSKVPFCHFSCFPLCLQGDRDQSHSNCSLLLLVVSTSLYCLSFCVSPRFSAVTSLLPDYIFAREENVKGQTQSVETRGKLADFRCCRVCPPFKVIQFTQ